MTTDNPTWHPMWSEPNPSRSRFAVEVSHPTRTLAVVAVTGELDLATCPRLESHLNAETNDRELRDLVVDLTALTFLAACGLRALSKAHRRTQAAHIVLQVVAQQTSLVGWLLARFLLDTVVLQPDLASARRSIAARNGQ